MTLSYEERQPSERLAAVVECVWRLQSDDRARQAPHRVLPDGCVELILQRGSRVVEQRPDQAPRLQPRVHVTGQLDRYLLLAARGLIDTLGVRFRPGAARALLRVPDGELSGRTLGAGEILGDSGRRELENAAGATEPLAAVLRVCEGQLDERLRPERRLRAAVDLVLATAGRLRVDRLADHLGLGPRTLERLFSRDIGLRPKQLSRIARLEAALLALSRNAHHSLADLAYACGYSDQAHLSREFRTLTGLTPTDWLRGSHPFARQFAAADRLDRMLSGGTEPAANRAFAAAAEPCNGESV